ncbi:MAG: hypothetical protein LHW59_11285 [Candidatus Cloacimonetes bacterium]|jgi:hypothetical protein|nr:hypothetical protein [Candidatus Cloacimonadota bacterium]
MKKVKQKILYMEGTKKRVGDIKSVFQSIEYSLNLLHTSLISTNNCIIFIYSWGHIIIYTFPQEQLITVEFLYQEWNKKIENMIISVVKIFEPDNYQIKEIDRW